MNEREHMGDAFAALARRALHEFAKVLGQAGDVCCNWQDLDAVNREAWVAAVRHVAAEVVALGAPATAPDAPALKPAPAFTGAPRVYIAGPMTDLPNLNFPAFHAEAARLRAMGFDVVNPAEINPDHTKGWHECMRSDIGLLVTCEAIRMLPGWVHSKGAQLELHIAERLGMRVYMPGAEVA